MKSASSEAIALSELPAVADRRQLDSLELAAVVYLALPMPLWLFGWFRLPVALALMAAVCCTAWPVLRAVRRVSSNAIPRRRWLAIVALATVWVALGGQGGGFFFNTDWLVRLSVLRDLTVGSWPISYGPTDDGGSFVLRFPLHYYLVPVAVAKLFGVGVARLALAAWTVAGVSLFFALTLTAWSDRSRRSTVVWLAVVVLFSGMDIIGWTTEYVRWPRFYEHLEWWTWFQYSSQTTALYWAPNHALPAWLGTLVLWRHRDHGIAAAPMALLLLLVAAWAPLPAVGIAPLLVACSLRGRPLRQSLRDLLRPSVLATLPVVLLLAAFSTFGISGRDSALNASLAEIHASVVLFILPEILRHAALEWLLLAVCIWRAGRASWLMWAAGIELLLLPALKFGPGNDIVMRGGAPAILIIALAAGTTLLSPSTPRRWLVPMVVMLAIGVVTPATEILRAFVPPLKSPDPNASMAQLYGKPWHYVGTLRPGWLQSLMRDPVALPGTPLNGASGSVADKAERNRAAGKP